MLNKHGYSNLGKYIGHKLQWSVLKAFYVFWPVLGHSINVGVVV